MSRPSPIPRLLACAVACLLSSACAPSRGEVRLAGAPARGAPRDAHEIARHVLTAVEMRGAGATSVIDAVRRLRPEFLTPARAAMDPGTANTGPLVYLDDAFVGTADDLVTIPLDAVIDVRYLTPSRGWDRWGSLCRCEAGVILVRTRR